MSKYSVTYTESDLQETLLSVDEKILFYKDLYSHNKIYWNPNTVKTRAWSFFVYPESAPEDWLEILESFQVSFCISPCHDKDVCKDGSPKKPHYHVIYICEGPAYFKSALVYMHAVNGCMLEPVHSLRGSVRYLVHMDSPAKHRYSEDDIITFSGFDYSEFFEMSEVQITDTSKAMTDFILSHGVTEYSDFAGVCASVNPYWYKILTEYQNRHFYALISSMKTANNFSFISFLYFIKPLVDKEFSDTVELLFKSFMEQNTQVQKLKFQLENKEEPEK